MGFMRATTKATQGAGKNRPAYGFMFPGLAGGIGASSLGKRSTKRNSARPNVEEIKAIIEKYLEGTFKYEKFSTGCDVLKLVYSYNKNIYVLCRLINVSSEKNEICIIKVDETKGEVDTTWSATSTNPGILNIEKSIVGAGKFDNVIEEMFIYDSPPGESLVLISTTSDGSDKIIQIYKVNISGMLNFSPHSISVPGEDCIYVKSLKDFTLTGAKLGYYIAYQTSAKIYIKKIFYDDTAGVPFSVDSTWGNSTPIDSIYSETIVPSAGITSINNMMIDSNSNITLIGDYANLIFPPPPPRLNNGIYIIGLNSKGIISDGTGSRSKLWDGIDGTTGPSTLQSALPSHFSLSNKAFECVDLYYNLSSSTFDVIVRITDTSAGAGAYTYETSILKFDDTGKLDTSPLLSLKGGIATPTKMENIKLTSNKYLSFSCADATTSKSVIYSNNSSGLFTSTSLYSITNSPGIERQIVDIVEDSFLNIYILINTTITSTSKTYVELYKVVTSSSSLDSSFGKSGIFTYESSEGITAKSKNLQIDTTDNIIIVSIEDTNKVPTTFPTTLRLKTNGKLDSTWKVKL